MNNYADLELGLHQHEVDSYSIELRFSLPNSEGEVRLISESRPLARFDSEQLLDLKLDDRGYGTALADMLFAEPSVRTALAEAQSAAFSQELSIRFRLFIGPSAPELQSLHWEKLIISDGVFLSLTKRMLFSRYLSSLDWTPVRLQSRAQLKALIVIANPTNIDEFGLASIDADRELEAAKVSLETASIVELTSPGSATLANITAKLEDDVDILYLICHGILARDQTWLWLEDEQGESDRIAGSEFVTALKDLRRHPRLVVLASCQSAGTGEEMSRADGGILAALGPQLAAAGIPAVVAMQGNITMQTMSEFMPTFFTTLQERGEIDYAMAVARTKVSTRSDWWVPTLFMRLKSGRLWYRAGFADQERELTQWDSLIPNIQDGKCTPILGPGLSESLLGSRRHIAQRWSETFRFPMAPHERNDLPQVAQFLAVHHGSRFPRRTLTDYLASEIRERYGEYLPDGAKQASLDELISTIINQRRATQGATEPHDVLAKMPLPIFVTTEPSRRMGDALEAADKDPQLEICRWFPGLDLLPSVYDNEKEYRPSVERPLVYHLFGRIDEPDSVVLTEDDYFDFMIGVKLDEDLIPSVVRRALADTALLFLGFRMDEWDFRVLLRSIMNQEGSRRRHSYTHVAVQIDPEESSIIDPEGARRYLESYFQDADISIYWGSADDFVRELAERWQAA